MQSLPRKGKKCRLTRANGVVVGDLVLFVFGLFSFVGFFFFVCLIFIFNFFFFHDWNFLSQTRPPKQTTCISCLHLSCMLQPGESPLQTLTLWTVTWSAVIQLNKCSYRQQVSLLSLIQDMTHWTWLNPNAANIYILEQTNLNKGITIRWMHQDRSVKSHKTLQNSVIPGPVATFNFLPAAKTISIQVSGNSMTCHVKNVHTRCKSPH